VRATAHLGWLGHGSVLLELDGVRLLADPLLRRRVAHLRRAVPLPPAPLLEIDAVLITHQHLDHLDLPSLELIGRELPLVVPQVAGPLLRRRHFHNVTEVVEGDVVNFGDVRVIAVPALHDGRRLLFGESAAALGYVIEGSRRVYLAGDTGLFAGMQELRPLDAAALPVWGWGPTLGPGHLSPEEAAEAVVLLDPRVAVPIHYGTYGPIGSPTPSREPALRFARLVADGPTRCQVAVLAAGEGIDLDVATVA
jgi:L-ascorbate metabolism protein UlaG (beta-lactamase superfamily)